MNARYRTGAGTRIQPSARSRHHAAQRRHRGNPTETPGERPQVVGQAALVRRTELAFGFRGHRRLMLDALLERVEVQDRIGVRRDERRQRHPAGEHQSHEHASAAPRLLQVACCCRCQQRQQHDPRRVLRRAARAQTQARERVPAQPPAAQHARGAQQRQRQRRQRRHVVERQVRVEHGQERDRLQRRRQQRRPTAQQPRTGRIQQPHSCGPEQRRAGARQREHGGRVPREGPRDPRLAAEPHCEKHVQQIRERGRVGEVMRVPAQREDPDRVGHEVRVLVGVVRVGQPLADPPHP